MSLASALLLRGLSAAGGPSDRDRCRRAHRAVRPPGRTCSTRRSCRSWGGTPRRSTSCAARCRCFGGRATPSGRSACYSNRSLMHVRARPSPPPRPTWWPRSSCAWSTTWACPPATSSTTSATSRRSSATSRRAAALRRGGGSLLAVRAARAVAAAGPGRRAPVRAAARRGRRPAARRRSTPTGTRKRDVHLPDALLHDVDGRAAPGGQRHGRGRRPEAGRAGTGGSATSARSRWLASRAIQAQTEIDPTRVSPRGLPGPPTTWTPPGGRCRPSRRGCWRVGWPSTRGARPPPASI